ncbi:MAG: vitamin B12 dependent-methionine synthase activation domain-containing protein, partial [Bacteroidota bacterium]
LSCNNYEVIDLGTMIPTEQIIEEVKSQKPDILGLSGLITPSLDEMVNVAAELEREGLSVPVMVGGATTSKAHTAVKIAPEYNAPVVHVKDASQSVGIVDKLISPKSREEFERQLQEEQQSQRERHLGRKKPESAYLSLEEARKNKPDIDWDSWQPVKPAFLGEKSFNNYNVEEISRYIDWTFFFYSWEIRGKYPNILDDPKKGEEARKLYDDGQKMLRQILDNNMVEANAVIGFYPVNSIGDDIEIYWDENMSSDAIGRDAMHGVSTNGSSTVQKLCFLRNQTIKKEGPNMCLADFVMPKEKKVVDYIGSFFATAGLGVDEWAEKFEKENDDYSAVMLKVLAQRLAEAFTELLHEKVRKELWGYAPDENYSPQELIKEKYQGIRPAFGYPSMPDHTQKKPVYDMMDVEKHTKIKLTDSYMMIPEASVSGLYFAHPQSRYFNVQKILEDQVQDYSRRTGMSVDEVRKWLSENLA